MIESSKCAFWAGIAWLAYVYIGYPVLLYFIGLFRPFTPKPSDKYIPKVSVLVSARNEEQNIGWKVEETLNWDYPEDQLEVLVASDASQDGTDVVLSKISSPRFRYLRLDSRKGKGEALNQLRHLAQGELVLFSDANSHIGPACLKTIVRHFADPRVGCVTGTEHTLCEGKSLMMSQGAGAFLDYEGILNTLESRIGSVLVCDGSIFCIRRSLFTVLQPEMANDLELPIRIGAKGLRLLFEPKASSFERAAGSPAEEYHRKRRICAQGLLGCWKLRHELKGLRSWQFLSRKLLRWLGAIPLFVIFLSSLQMASRRFYFVVLVAQLVFYGLAGYGWRLASKNKQGSRLMTLPFYFLLVNAGAFVGVIQTLFGRRFSLWEGPNQSRGLPQPHQHHM
jgi:cellulose synthase/poly-beta-1,6-N-acetylglucosamine synthase-like glycosyltransferase